MIGKCSLPVCYLFQAIIYGLMFRGPKLVFARPQTAVDKQSISAMSALQIGRTSQASHRGAFVRINRSTVSKAGIRLLNGSYLATSKARKKKWPRTHIIVHPHDGQSLFFVVVMYSAAGLSRIGR